MTTAPQPSVAARTLPDEYAGLGVPSGTTVLDLVARRWGDRSEGDRRQLAQILIMVLEPLNEPGARITEELRATCEQVVTEWVDKTAPAGQSVSAPPPSSAALKARRVRLVETEGGPSQGGQWSARVVLQVGARRHAGVDSCREDSVAQLHCAGRATIEALRQAVPGLPHIELKKLETFDAFESLGVIVALRITEGDAQNTLVGVCPNTGSDMVRAVAIAVLNATNRRLGTG